MKTSSKVFIDKCLKNVFLFALFALFDFFALSYSAQFDPDIESKNGLALKQYAQALKHGPKAPAYLVALVRTDTDTLIKAAYSNDLSDFVRLIKGAFKRVFNTWIDTLLPADGDILEFNPVAVINTPTSKSKADFKAAFASVIDAYVVLKAAPVNASMKALLDTAIAVHTEISKASTDWLIAIAPIGNIQYTALFKKNAFLLKFPQELAYDNLF